MRINSDLIVNVYETGSDILATEPKIAKNVKNLVIDKPDYKEDNIERSLLWQRR